MLVWRRRRHIKLMASDTCLSLSFPERQQQKHQHVATGRTPHQPRRLVQGLRRAHHQTRLNQRRRTHILVRRQDPWQRLCCQRRTRRQERPRHKQMRVLQSRFSSLRAASMPGQRNMASVVSKAEVSLGMASRWPRFRYRSGPRHKTVMQW